jgi:RNA polymerase sigma factor (sigma-70 family)
MANKPDQHDSESFLVQAMSDWGNAVYRLALSQTRSRADADDVYQDVFLRLFNDRTDFQSNEHVKAWLLRVTANRCRDLEKSSWKRRTVTLDPERDAPETPARTRREEDVWEAIGKLPEYQRTVVHLHYIEGYSTQEISQIMDCRPATVRTWLFRARNRIKDILDSSNEEAPDSVMNCAVAEPDAIG